MLACSIVYAAQNSLREPDASLDVKLVDESGVALAEKKMYIHDDSGRSNSLAYGVTGGGGEVVLNNRSIAKVRVFGISGDMRNLSEYKDFYLDKGMRYRFNEINLVLNRWEPWNPEVTYVVKRIKNPVPMLTRSFNSSSGTKPLQIGLKPDVEYTLDLVEGDWLPPYGKGKTGDVVCTLLTNPDGQKWSEYLEYNKRYGDIASKKHYTYLSKNKAPDKQPLRVKMKFLREGDGILFDDYGPRRFLGGSILYHSHEAPASGYKQEFVYDVVDEFLAPMGTAYMRIRSGEGAMHLVTDAFKFAYGPIYTPWQPGDGPPKEIGKATWFTLSYKLNPNPASRSLEWNGVDARTGKLVRENWRENQRP